MSQALTTNEIRSDINSESNVKDPKVGMTFPSWDAVDSYYHVYGKQRGFGVVRAVVSYKQKAGRSTREKRAEKEADANCWKHTRTLLTAFPFEAQFRDVYTDAKFKEVQVQCSRVLYVTPLEKRVVLHTNKEKREEIATMKRTYCVWFDTALHDSGCGCKHFECYGIMCRHLIKVYYMYNVEHVPSKFIVRRWRIDIQRKHMVVKVAYHDLSKTAQVQRFDKLMVEFERVCLKVSLLDVNIQTCMELIQLMDLRVEENNTKFYESAHAGDPSSVTPESTSNGIA
ncbi:Protein FAR1-RELATED SEQUENCE 2 [Bienertia sinuspersici]